MKHNSLCPGVYSLELFECQVYISNCVNTLTSNTAWNGSKLVEKKTNTQGNIQSEEEIIAISCQRGDDHSWSLVQGTSPHTMCTSWVPRNKPSAICLHDTTYLSWYQCWPWHYIYHTDFSWSMTSRYLHSYDLFMKLSPTHISVSNTSFCLFFTNSVLLHSFLFRKMAKNYFPRLLFHSPLSHNHLLHSLSA